LIERATLRTPLWISVKAAFTSGGSLGWLEDRVFRVMPDG
jgi:hypothetical protein